MKDIAILFEDENFLVLNKPAGLPVQGGKGVKSSLDSLLAQSYRERPFLVHRLDKDTSGVIVTAKTRECAAACSAFFSGSRQGLKKAYLAFCAGILEKKGTINENLKIKGKEQNACTSYIQRGCSILPCPDKEDEKIHVSLAEVFPSTGRMHQIRRHLAQKGNPVLLDEKYGNFALNKKLIKNLGIKRMFLHALSIYMPPPLIKGGLEISAPLPDYFKEMIERTGMVLRS